MKPEVGPPEKNPAICFFEKNHFPWFWDSVKIDLSVKKAQARYVGPIWVDWDTNINIARQRVYLSRLRADFAQTWICYSSRRVLALQRVKL